MCYLLFGLCWLCSYCQNETKTYLPSSCSTLSPLQDTDWLMAQYHTRAGVSAPLTLELESICETERSFPQHHDAASSIQAIRENPRQIPGQQANLEQYEEQFEEQSIWDSRCHTKDGPYRPHSSKPMSLDTRLFVELIQIQSSVDDAQHLPSCTLPGQSSSWVSSLTIIVEHEADLFSSKVHSLADNLHRHPVFHSNSAPFLNQHCSSFWIGPNFVAGHHKVLRLSDSPPGNTAGLMFYYRAMAQSS